MRGAGRVAILLGSLGVLLARPAPGAPSSYSVAPAGSKVLYLLLQDLGYQVGRVFDLDEVDASVRVLVMVGPESGREGKRVLEWVQRGHQLVLAPPIISEEGHCPEFRFGELTIKRTRPGESSSELAHPDLKLKQSICLLATPETGQALAGAREHALAFDHAAKEGRMLVLAHEDILLNANLDHDDIAVLLRRWLATHVPAGAKVVFVEGRQGGELLEIARRARLLPFLLHGLLFLLLLYWALAPRFGDPSSTVISTRRAFAQHARALGRLYRHRGASGYLLRQQYERFLDRVLGRTDRRGFGGQRTASSRTETAHSGRERAAIAARISTRSGRDADSVESLLAQLEYQSAGPDVADPKDVQRHFRLGQALAALQHGQPAKAGIGTRKKRPKNR
jgi:hypothetical protein